MNFFPLKMLIPWGLSQFQGFCRKLNYLVFFEMNTVIKIAMIVVTWGLALKIGADSELFF